MLICPQCGFYAAEDSEDWIESVERIYADGLCVDKQHLYSCPECGCDDLETAIKCERCGEYIAEDQAVLHTVTFAPDDEYPEGSEDTIRICQNCCDELAESEATNDDV